MQYSSTLLQSLISSSLVTDHQALADALLAKVCEVEDIHIRRFDPLLVVGKVISLAKHSNADSLFVVQLDCGHHGNVQICTWWENVELLTYVPVALPWCYLPALDLTITSRTMRWEPSHWMICSKEELWIPEDTTQHWIWTMNYDCPQLDDTHIWMPLSEVLPRLVSWSMDIENKTITHRADLFWHFGLALELMALDPQAKLQRLWSSIVDACSCHVSWPSLYRWALEWSDSTDVPYVVTTPLCSVYTLLQCDLPSWWQSSFQDRVSLYDIWSTPKYTVVDLSNIWMMLTWQPIHMFDAATVVWRIQVRHALDGEIFVDLHGKEHTLIADDIVIADDTNILALAWVMGWQWSAVTPHTEQLYVELAHFDPIRIRKTAVRLGLRTDAATRFEKYINPVYTYSLVEVLKTRLQDALGVVPQYYTSWVSPFLHEQWQQYGDKTLVLDWKQISHALYWDDRLDIPHARFLLERLWCKFWDTNHLHVPCWRTPQEWNVIADVVEEVARHIGFDALPDSTYSIVPRFVPYNPLVTLRRKFEELASHLLHMHQVETYPWMLPHHHDLVMTSSTTLHDQFFAMDNPLTPEQKYLRSCVHWHLVDTIAKNAPYRWDIAIFDIGSVWHKHLTDSPLWAERLIFSAAWRSKDQWESFHNTLFLKAKWALQVLCGQILWTKHIVWAPHLAPAYHPHQHMVWTLWVWNNPAFFMATVHPTALQICGLPHDSTLVVTEIDLTLLASQMVGDALSTSSVQYHTLQDHITTKDVSFLIPLTESFDKLMGALGSVAWVAEIDLFDVYVGDRIPQWYKSITLRCTILGEGSLDSDRVGSVFNSLIEAWRLTWAVLRDS
jgi:phenylalanyl-tRNA synthetase beta chain